jgi:hypothetical protein
MVYNISLWNVELTEAGGEGANMLTKVFRIGPVLLLPPMISWAAVCFNIGSSEAYDWWRSYPIFGAVVIAALWHLFLIGMERNRFDYMAYALVHLPVFIYVAFISGVYATRAPL